MQSQTNEAKRTKQSKAQDYEAKQSKAKQYKAKQSKASCLCSRLLLLLMAEPCPVASLPVLQNLVVLQMVHSLHFFQVVLNSLP